MKKILILNYKRNKKKKFTIEKLNIYNDVISKFTKVYNLIDCFIISSLIYHILINNYFNLKISIRE
jgi:hypothetical protein